MVSPGVPRKYTWDGIQNSHVRCKLCKLWRATAYSRVSINLPKMAAVLKHTTPGDIQPSTAHPNCYRNLQYAYPRMRDPPTPWPPHCRQAQPESIHYVEAEARDNQSLLQLVSHVASSRQTPGRPQLSTSWCPIIFQK